MNILDIIKDCIVNPCFAKEYSLEEITIDTASTKTYTNESVFSGLSSFKKIEQPSIDQRMIRIYMRVWSNLCKYIAKVITEDKCFINSNIGYFFPIRGILSKYGYSPPSKVIDSYGVTLYEDAYNIHPLKRFVSLVNRVDNNTEGLCNSIYACRLLLYR